MDIASGGDCTTGGETSTALSSRVAHPHSFPGGISIRRRHKAYRFTAPWLKGLQVAQIPDPELIAGCLAGDSEAWNALIDRYAPLINTVTIRMGIGPEDGADVLQEVCIHLLGHLQSLRDHSRLSAWVITTTRREAWKVRRRRGMTTLSTVDAPKLETADPLLGDTGSGPEAAVLQLAEHDHVRQCMERLPDLCRSLLRLLYYDDPPASYAEAALRLDMASNSVGPNRSRCLRRLREILEEESK